MEPKYSTGDLAKLCSVSIRTIQFYDKEGIIKPSELSEGGRRIYTDDELNKLKCVCLYKSLGFSLDEIKTVVNGAGNIDFFEGILSEHQAKMNAEIDRLVQIRERLKAISHQIHESGQIKVRNIDEMNSLLEKKQNHRKTDILTYVFLSCYVLLLIGGFPLAVSIGGASPYIMLVISIVLLFGLIYYHKEVNAYVCPKCRHKFSIGFWRDLFSLNGGKKGKYLKCPACRNNGWFSESHPE